jgi:hypothetical protein
VKEEKAAAVYDNKKTHATCTRICAYNLKSSSRTYRYRSYCVNPCHPHSLGLPPSTVVSSTVVSSTVALISTVASPSTEAPHNSTRNTEWPPALTYNIPDVPILCRLIDLTFAYHLNFSPLRCPRSLFHPKQSPINLVAPYYFIICRINIDTTAP